MEFRPFNDDEQRQLTIAVREARLREARARAEFAPLMRRENAENAQESEEEEFFSLVERKMQMLIKKVPFSAETRVMIAVVLLYTTAIGSCLALHAANQRSPSMMKEYTPQDPHSRETSKQVLEKK